MKNIKNIKITYIGGGSRAWARNLMNDLAKDDEIGGEVCLYDIDEYAAKQNAIIGNALSARTDVKGKWNYRVINNLNEALKNADFVIISILPGTFDEMESDVHTPEKYGIWQSVGDSTGPGGIVRSLRTVPMFVTFAEAIKEVCPTAWVINFTNPMTICTKTLYEVFPDIKAFGCCHEVFGAQKVLAKMVEKKYGIGVTRDQIDINVLGVNHFTWIDAAHYKNEDLFPLIKEYVENNSDGIESSDNNWANRLFETKEKVKFDLFRRFGVLGAAGDRHLAEFCPGKWYLESPETVTSYGFALTTVAWRKKDLGERIEKTEELVNGKKFDLFDSGEESVKQMKALLGLGNFVTNVNIPNIGQMGQTKLNAVVETNAYFSGDSVRPIYAGVLPDGPKGLVDRIITCQEMTVTAALKGDYELAFEAFVCDPNMCLDLKDARKLFDEMLFNTRKYLPYYDKYINSKK